MNIQLPPVNDLIGYVAGIVTIVLLAAKKFKDLTGFLKKEKKPDDERENSLLDFAIREKNSAIEQRNEALAAAEQLKRANFRLETELTKMQRELQLMKNRLTILTELNNRLVQNLEDAQVRLLNHMTGKEPAVPQTPLEEAQAVLLQGGADVQDVAPTLPMLHSLFDEHAL